MQKKENIKQKGHRNVNAHIYGSILLGYIKQKGLIMRHMSCTTIIKFSIT